MIPVVTLFVDDPSVLSWPERAEMRSEAAAAYRRQHDTRDEIGVDILPASDGTGDVVS